MLAVYRGLKVTVYVADKTDISLTRQDLVELINVCSFLHTYINQSISQSIKTYLA